MPLRSTLAALAWLTTLLLVSFASRVARADETESCIQGAEQGYRLKGENKLVEARKRLQTCAGPSCPSALAPSCVEWLAEVEAALPSIVIHAQDGAGSDLRGVRVKVDGNTVASELDGTAIPIDPGAHTLRFELAGSADQTLEVIIRSGEKNRQVEVRFAAAPTKPEPESKPRFSRAPAVIAFVVGGLAFDVAAATGIAAWVDKTKLDEVCPTRQTCPASEAERVDRVAATSIASTVALPIAGTGLGLGVLLWVLSNPKPVAIFGRANAPSAVTVEPMAGPGGAGIRGSF